MAAHGAGGLAVLDVPPHKARAAEDVARGAGPAVPHHGAAAPPERVGVHAHGAEPRAPADRARLCVLRGLPDDPDNVVDLALDPEELELDDAEHLLNLGAPRAPLRGPLEAGADPRNDGRGLAARRHEGLKPL